MDAILAVNENYSATLAALDEIQDNLSNGCVSSEACGLRHQMLKFEYLICLLVLREDIDIVSTLHVVDSTVKTLELM